MIQYKIKSFGEEWDNDLGQVLPGSTKNNVSCLFNKNDVGHLPTMDKPYFVVRDFFIPPNSIDFSTVFEKFDLKNNGAVFGTIIGILLLIFLVGLWARKADQVNKKQWKVLPVKGSNTSNQYRYLIAICTGGMPNAGTKSNIFCRISFTQTSSGTFELDNGFCKGFQRGSIRAFILPMNSCPGNPQSLRIWNDSSGEGHNRSWFLSEILLHDAQTEQTFHFIFNVWLGYEHERTSALAKPADETMLCDKKRQFSVETKNNFSDAHLWSSIFLQYARNPFTSLQRLACCFLLLFLMMITNAMWFETAKPETLKIGPFTPGDIFIIIVSSLMEIPVSLLVVQIFRRRRAKHHSLEFSSGYLPYWTIYIAWTIVVLTIITSGFFVISLQHGVGSRESKPLAPSLLQFFYHLTVLHPTHQGNHTLYTV
uniref:PLAT domain-containing protein n=2 Tax=Eptatretus burgeri TaxID=7764 RepID=A0A8C4QFH4_EPTBU